MANLPGFVIILFVITSLISLYLFSKAVRGNKTVIISAVVWMVLNSVIALTGFYSVSDSIIPRVLYGVAPPLVVIAILFLTASGRQFLDTIDLKWATLHQSVRLLVEISLFMFFIYKQVSIKMTFEGGNFDILSGLTAGLAWYLYSKGKIGKTGLLVWNFICLALVGNAVLTTFLTGPYPFQVWSFDQPTVTVLYFPGILLAVFIVPVVLFCHLVSIRQLLKKNI
jgi:hypothetical protein